MNRLIQVKDSGNSLIVDYYYNADNLRVEKHHAGGAKEQFYYCDAFVVEDQDGSQALVREYMQGGQYIDKVIAVKTGGSYYYMYDLRFNEYGFVDSTGAVVESTRYDGYGKRTLMDASFSTIGSPVVDQPYSYTGQRLDTESGLQYYRARYFDNDMGRFISRDPIGYVDGLNLYRGYFVKNGLDPSGKETLYTLCTHFKTTQGKMVCREGSLCYLYFDKVYSKKCHFKCNSGLHLPGEVPANENLISFLSTYNFAIELCSSCPALITMRYNSDTLEITLRLPLKFSLDKL